VAVPNAEWRSQSGLIPHTLDENVTRLDRTTWDVTNQAQTWYFQSDDRNTGLVMVGYDEGSDFSNDADCLSIVTSVRLTVDFVSEDPTLTPTPTFLQQVEANGRSSSGGLPSGTPLVYHYSPGFEPFVPTATPTPPPDAAVSKVLPDLLISGVETNGVNNSRDVQPPCSAGQDMIFTVHVKNVGPIDTTGPYVISLTVDDVPRRRMSKRPPPSAASC
jgi:hypothetical protein